MIPYLLKLEWLKFRKLTAFRILTIGYLLLLPAVILIFKSFPEPPEQMMSINDFYAFPTVWGWLGYIGNWISFFCLGFMGVLSVSIEFGNKTLRQNIITGMSRQQIFLGKILLMLALAAVFTLYYLIVGLIYGFLHTEMISSSLIFGSAGPWIIGRYFLMCFGYLGLGFFFGMLTRRTGLAIFLFLIYTMFLELFLRWVVHLNAIQHRSMIFYPVNSINYLMPVPIMQNEVKQTGRELGFSFIMEPWEAAITLTVYLAIFLFLSYRLLTRKDL